MEERKFYDPTKLLSMVDINNQRPAYRLCVSNNSAGKTTNFSRVLLNRFKNEKKQFLIQYRWDYEVEYAVDHIFDPVKNAFPDKFGHDEMSIKVETDKKGKQIKTKGFSHLYMNGDLCGFAVALNSIQKIKLTSGLFNYVDTIFQDEFQPEDNHYLPDEMRRFMGIHKAVARGQGQQARYVETILSSNPVTILNPYYTAWGISSRLKEGAKFIKGNGWVLEQHYNESAANAISEDPAMRAFLDGDPNYFNYSTKGLYLNDNVAFVEKLTGKNTYLCTLLYNGESYAIRRYDDLGLLYCDNKADENFPTIIAMTTDDHNPNARLLQKSNPMMVFYRKAFDSGIFRFKNLRCKEIILKLLSY